MDMILISLEGDNFGFFHTNEITVSYTVSFNIYSDGKYKKIKKI